MLILAFHIIIALVTTLAIAGVLTAAYRRNETKFYMTMLVSFGATAVSGIALLFVSANGLGRFCAMMSAYAVFVAIAHRYYRVRISTTSSL